MFLYELLNPKCAFTSYLGSVSQLLLIFLFSFSTGCFRDKIKRHGDGSTFDVLCSRHAHCSFPKASCLGWPEAFCRVWKHACRHACIIRHKQNSEFGVFISSSQLRHFLPLCTQVLCDIRNGRLFTSIQQIQKKCNFGKATIATLLWWQRIILLRTKWSLLSAKTSLAVLLWRTPDPSRRCSPEDHPPPLLRDCKRSTISTEETMY